MAHAFNFSTRAGGRRQVDLCEFEDRLVYKRKFQDRLRSYSETVSKNKKTKQTKTQVNK